MTYRISKEFHFCASHQLDHLPDDHPCYRLHGHNYVVTIGFESEELNENGFVVDFRELDDIKHWIDEIFDHQHINDRLDCYTTNENIARKIYEQWQSSYPQLSFVRVAETPKTQATYYESKK